MLRGYLPEEASQVLDRDGEEVAKLFVTRRVAVGIDSIPSHVQDAFVAIEDKRFWQHDGVDWRRVMGAFVSNVKAGGVAEGSSTITMQLARNIFPDKLPASEQTLWRKLGEARVARQIEGHYRKDEILELYLNQIYFGEGAWGIESAAQEYFGKGATDLGLAEAATLAALPRAPSRLNPRANPAAAKEGRELVLERMVEQGMITAAEREEALAAPLRLRKRTAKSSDEAPYFVEAVRRQLEEQLGDAIYTEGYIIHTTLDLEAQRSAEQALTAQIRAIESGRYGAFPHETYASVHSDSSGEASGREGTAYLQGALIVMEALSGDVLALIGGRDFDDSEFNRATQAMRQPGSAFKPFVYAAALQSGLPPTHRLLDQPLRLRLDRNRVWEPQNYEGGYSGVVSMREALTYSKNVATVRLASEVGLGEVLRLAQNMGLGTMQSNPAVVLGTSEVTPLQLTSAYSAFASLGNRAEPRFVIRVEDRSGRTVWSRQPFTERVIDPAVAYLTVSLMEDVVNRGTGTGVRAAGYRGAAAGKTGTTQDAADAWFVGVTPTLVGTVWIGFDRRQRILRSATGGELAAPVWGRVMSAVTEGSSKWPVPAGVEQHTVTTMGAVVGEGCPADAGSHQEYFLAGTAPSTSCWVDPYLAYADTLGIYSDSVWADYEQRRAEEESWWARLRERIFVERDTLDATPIEIDVDTLRQPTRPTIVPPDTTLPDSGERASDTARLRPLRPLGTPQTPPTRPDTVRVRPDTSGVREPLPGG